MEEDKDRQEQNRGKALVEAGVFLVILNVLSAVHLWSAVSGRWQVEGDSLLIEQAWIRQGEAAFEAYNGWELYYICLIRFLFSFLGNHQQVVLAANIFLQLFGVFFFYRGGRRLLNRVAALILAVIMGIVSAYSFPVNEDSAFHLAWFALGLLFWLFSFVRPIISSLRGKAADKHALNETRAERTDAKPVDSEALPKEVGKNPMTEDSITEISVTKKGEKEKVKLIPNPLPLPKKHVKKEMNYAFEPPKELMRYDLNNYNVSDDYDLKGM